MMGLAEQQAQMSGPSVDEVVSMLMQGMDPEELVQQGIPLEVVKEAVEIVLAQEQQMATQNQSAQTPSGLAMQAAQGM